MVSILSELHPDNAPEWTRTPQRQVARLHRAHSLCTHNGGTGPCATMTPYECQCGAAFNECSRIAVPVDSDGASLCRDCRVNPRCPRCHKRTDCQCVSPVVKGYHSPDRPQLATPVLGSECDLDGDIFVGVEIEAVWDDAVNDAHPLIGDLDEVNTLRAVALDRFIGPALQPLRPVLLSIESDSSLGAYGAEVITRPLPLSILREALPQVLAAMAASGAKTDARCGGHIHISRTNGVHMGAKRVAGLYGRPDQLRFWDAICGRAANAYRGDRGPNRPASPVSDVNGYLPGERAALWACDRVATVEWRHPSGTLDPRVWLGRIELLLDVCAHAAQPDNPSHPWNLFSKPWSVGRYLKERPAPTPETRYAFALRRSLGY